jgi:hypothetical protein
MGFGVGTRPEEVERETLESLRTGIAALEARAPDEVDAYRQFVREVAQSVAVAAGGGEASESQTIEKVESALA